VGVRPAFSDTQHPLVPVLQISTAIFLSANSKIKTASLWKRQRLLDRGAGGTKIELF